MSNQSKMYLSEVEASQRYGYSRQWFQRERWKGTGPRFLKISARSKILYPLEDTDRWFSDFGLRKSTSTQVGGDGHE